MEGIIKNFKLGRHTKSSNQMIVEVSSIRSREEASKLVGKKVEFLTESGKKINGEVKSAHGNSGALRVAFEKGMPGQAIAQKVKINA